MNRQRIKGGGKHRQRKERHTRGKHRPEPLGQFSSSSRKAAPASQRRGEAQDPPGRTFGNITRPSADTPTTPLSFSRGSLPPLDQNPVGSAEEAITVNRRCGDQQPSHGTLKDRQDINGSSALLPLRETTKKHPGVSRVFIVRHLLHSKGAVSSGACYPVPRAKDHAR